MWGSFVLPAVSPISISRGRVKNEHVRTKIGISTSSENCGGDSDYHIGAEYKIIKCLQCGILGSRRAGHEDARRSARNHWLTTCSDKLVYQCIFSTVELDIPLICPHSSDAKSSERILARASL